MTRGLNSKSPHREREPLPLWQAILISLLLAALFWSAIIGGAYLLYRLTS